MNNQVGDDEKEGRGVPENEAADPGILKTTISAQQLASFDWSKSSLMLMGSTVDGDMSRVCDNVQKN